MGRRLRQSVLRKQNKAFFCLNWGLVTATVFEGVFVLFSFGCFFFCFVLWFCLWVDVLFSFVVVCFNAGLLCVLVSFFFLL